MQASQDPAAGSDFRSSRLRHQAENRSDSYLCPMRSTNHGTVLPVTGKAGLLPVMFSSGAYDERHGLMVSSVLEVIGNIGNHNSSFEKECPLQKQSILIMQ
jgi:hypothetical protein